MSKIITLAPDILEQCTKEFYEALKAGKFPDGKVNFTKELGTVDRKATVFFDEMAWQKMQLLIREFDKEVAWHGIAKRGEEKDTYLISDILVYPQEVTGATVTTDQEEYQMWLMQKDDDVFNNIRMQGHSHVNMGVTPSAVDLNLYESILDQLDSDMFYIFMIWNKRGDKTVKIYDLRENILFETADVTVSVCEEENGLTSFLKAAKDLVVSKPVTYNYGYNNRYPGYGGYPSYGTKKDDDKKEDTKSAGTSLGKQQPLALGNKKSKGRKGKRKNGNKSAGKQMSMSDYGYPNCDDDHDAYDGYSEYEDEYWRRKYGFD